MLKKFYSLKVTVFGIIIPEKQAMGCLLCLRSINCTNPDFSYLTNIAEICFQIPLISSSLLKIGCDSPNLIQSYFSPGFEIHIVQLYISVCIYRHIDIKVYIALISISTTILSYRNYFLQFTPVGMFGVCAFHNWEPLG